MRECDKLQGINDVAKHILLGRRLVSKRVGSLISGLLPVNDVLSCSDWQVHFQHYCTYLKDL